MEQLYEKSLKLLEFMKYIKYMTPERPTKNLFIF